MNKFDELCIKALNLSTEERNLNVSICVNNIIDECREGGLNQKEALSFIIRIVCCAVAKDGRFSASEYPYVKVMLEAFGSGRYLTYDDCLNFINNLRGSEDLEGKVLQFTRGLGNINDDLQANIVLLCLYVCASDGVLTADERKFILNLFV